MNLPKLTDNLNIIGSLSNQPTLTSEELKQKFDESSNKIKDFLNNILIENLKIQLEAELNTMKETLQSSITNLRPVGSLYIATNNEDPNELWIGTTWKKIEDAFLFASGKHELGEIGGEETHILDINEIPSHIHGISDPGHSHSVGVHNGAYDNISSAGTGTTNGSWSISTSKAKTGISINATGGGKEHNNMPPYLVVNIWERTA